MTVRSVKTTDSKVTGLNRTNLPAERQEKAEKVKIYEFSRSPYSSLMELMILPVCFPARRAE